jgi:putative membrane protein
MRHKGKADLFFTTDQKTRLMEATKAVEERTSGEIAIMVVDGSSRYRETEVTGGIFFGSLAALLLTLFYFHGSLWYYIPLSFILFFPARFLFRRFPTLKASLTGRKRKGEAVKERALKAFYEKGLYRTAHHTGVLYFISLLERKVWVLADKGIHEKVKQVTLNKLARIVSIGIREGRAFDALLEAIGETGDLLALHFPAQPGDEDEFPDEVICESVDNCTE